MPALPNELHLGHNVLTQDSIPSFNYPTITEEERLNLHLKSGVEVPENTKVIGVREIEGKRTLEAYLVPLGEDPNDFKVYLMTRGSDGNCIESMDLGRLHKSEHQGPMRFGGNRFYTLDTSISFNGKTGFTVHYTLTLTSIYLKNHQLTQMWRVDWDDEYEIDNDGRPIIKNRKETLREGTPAEEVVEQYKKFHTLNDKSE